MPSTKRCKSCDKDLDTSDFYLSNKTTGTLSSLCKQCHSARSKEYHKNNRHVYRARQVAARRRYLEYLKGQSCGENDPVVLTHDHRDPKTKRTKVSAMIGKFGWKTIEKEIAKCDVVCANCHARRTAQMQGWYQG